VSKDIVKYYYDPNELGGALYLRPLGGLGHRENRTRVVSAMQCSVLRCVKVRDPEPRRTLKRTIMTALKRTIIKSPKTKRNDAWMWIWGGAARTEEIEKRDRRNGYSLGKAG
jgi:hypothetical protein